MRSCYELLLFLCVCEEDISFLFVVHLVLPDARLLQAAQSGELEAAGSLTALRPQERAITRAISLPSGFGTSSTSVEVHRTKYVHHPCFRFTILINPATSLLPLSQSAGYSAPGHRGSEENTFRATCDFHHYSVPQTPNFYDRRNTVLSVHGPGTKDPM